MKRQIATSNIFIIIDDEKYLAFSNDEVPHNVGFHAFDKKNASDNVKYKTKGKCQKKILVWSPVSSKDISTHFLGTRKDFAIIVDIYINKCLSKLRSSIEEHHAGDEYTLWPDLASSHFVNETTPWLLQQKIKFVARQVNPTNVRKARPIEDFWSILADKVYEEGREAKTKLQLKRIYREIKQIDIKVVQHMMTSTRAKLPFPLV